MKYKVIKAESKSPDWKVCTLERIDGTVVENVTINRNDKKGALFPNFDALLTGYEFEGNEWTSTQGRTYLFPPKIASGRTFTPKPRVDFKEAQDRKAGYIKEAQERKDNSIAFFNATNSAIAVTQHMTNPANVEEKRQEIIEWRDWFLQEWDSFNQEIDA